ncbi:cytochrome b5 [Angomonas deanei]|uniref:Cytochrome b5-like Heme/Steroid binding domain containing protein, putative n=1 Tax=Angomonas deanei TaxID=59799 RepID=A0A7G2C0V2_9TRYP|nr:cytochrome b5 [Angomonas deanei]CAD2213350.1 Cytochrome b5-like Heme/Steroid binding domain containing protein, putative [Angomonas deanei]|eukprot:EPY23359.1 cytochrome b5 [Angomonas deanei]
MLRAVLSFLGIVPRYPELTEEEVRCHNSRSSLWIVAGHSVYDVTPILRSHPGGEAALLRRGGGVQDCAKDYTFHSRYACGVWHQLKVGELPEMERCRLFVQDPPATDVEETCYRYSDTASVELHPSAHKMDGSESFTRWSRRLT